MLSKADAFSLDDRLRYCKPRIEKSWATLAELQTVIPFHLQCYKTILEECRKKSFVTSTNLTFATRFVAVFMFVRVKGCRPMTYQHLTVRMFESTKTNAGAKIRIQFSLLRRDQLGNCQLLRSIHATPAETTM